MVDDDHKIVVDTHKTLLNIYIILVKTKKKEKDHPSVERFFFTKRVYKNNSRR